MATNKGQFVESGTQLEKDFDKIIKPMLEASQGGIFRQYCDFETIEGESKVETNGTPGNYEDTAPNVYATKPKGTAGGTRTWEVAPHFIYGHEILGPYEKVSLKQKGGISENSWFMTSLISALEIGEDIEIIKALEDSEKLLPTANKLGDVSKPLYHPQNLKQFKALLVYARSRFKGKKVKGDFGAWAIIHALDWSKIELLEGDQAIFADKDYAHMTGIDNQNITTVCGVAIEEVDDLDRNYGSDGGRNYYVKSGTIWVCVLDNIKLVAWEDSVRSKSEDNLLNEDTFAMVVSKSMGAKVKNPKGVWKFSAKPETTFTYEEVGLGEEKNPIHTKTVGAGA